MNLAHVEYYFSEFLSKLQSNDKNLDLYSKHIHDELIEELNLKIDKINPENISSEDLYKLKRQWSNIHKYPAELKITDNVRFVGTINKDETTKNLSPKVIDRSFVIEVDNISSEGKKEIISHINRNNGGFEERLNLRAIDFKIKRDQVGEVLSAKIDKINSIVRNLNVYLNNRFYDQVDQVIGSKIFDNDEEFLDTIVSTMVLPKINVNIDSEINKYIKEIFEEIENARISTMLLNKMEEYSIREDILTFWR